MIYRSQRVAYFYFLAALVLFALQVAFGFLLIAKYLGPDPLLYVVNFATAKEIHTNLLLVWLLTGFMGAAYYLVPEESRTEIHSETLAWVQLGLWLAIGVTTIVGYLFGVTEGRKFLEMPFALKLGVVVVFVIFLYNVAMTIRNAGRFTTTEGILIGGLASAALLFVPGLIPFDNYTLDRFYRWWVVHLWVEGVWELIQGGLLAFLLIRLSGADREVLEKWLYVIVGLTFLSGILGTGHHYYWIGTPRYWLWVGGVFSALEPLAFLGMAAYAYNTLRRSGLAHPNTTALHWTIGSALFSTLGAGILGLSHTWPQVNRWTHGTHITTMHGHMAFFGAYVMIVLAIITYSLPALTGRSDEERQTGLGLWAFWLMVGGMFGMTMAFAASGITQTYLERILGLGYLETQQKIQVHYLMVLGAGTIFATGVALFLIDFVRAGAPETATRAVPAITVAAR
ncbi:MAG TPA: cbb3-type cytochrome c oxidase subunit I [Myxococcota bacterium]|jgi:nitric oxide reductase subunit B|nr:cbb3-type cytochrome c oxidase subunit I [Myxococcota bacterium]